MSSCGTPHSSSDTRRELQNTPRTPLDTFAPPPFHEKIIPLFDLSKRGYIMIDMKKEKRIGSIDTFKNRGLLPNLIVLLPEWNLEAGH